MNFTKEMMKLAGIMGALPSDMGAVPSESQEPKEEQKQTSWVRKEPLRKPQPKDNT